MTPALAFDLGTTTIAASLVDTATGRRLASSGSLNPQRSFGADVVSRLDAACRSDQAHAELSRLVRSELERMGRELAAEAGFSWREIRSIAVAGNPAMQHLLLGLPVRSLAFPPYRPLFTSGRFTPSAELGWENDAQVYTFPMPGGFVGGDTVAFLYGIDPGNHSFCLDLGTNGEMALVAGDIIWATSAAAGPAFEGGNLLFGMPALMGGINSVRIRDDRLKLEVIGGGVPAGICGSGAIEAVSELLEAGVVDRGGRLKDADEIPSNLGSRIISTEDGNAFVLYRDANRSILLTQADIRNMQLAKGAIRAGMDVLSERSCIRCEALQDVVLTGSFGAVLRPGWLKTIGIFSPDMVHITRFIKEGALAGTERALCAADRFDGVERLAQRMRVVPLSGTPLFEKKFMEHIPFPTL